MSAPILYRRVHGQKTPERFGAAFAVSFCAQGVEFTSR